MSRNQTTARARLYAALNPIDQPSRLSVVILVLIFVSTATAIVETEVTISEAYSWEFHVLELIFGVLFAIEYAARIWCAFVKRDFGRDPGVVAVFGSA
jgi:hypothetical protein